MQQASCVAIIPARGGSKSILRKNLVPLAGRGLIAYTIQAGLQAESVQRVIVSTDSPEIAEAAKAEGAEVPFLRPEELAADETLAEDTLLHAVHWLAENEAYRAEYVLLLQPTSPFRTAEDIDAAMALAEARQADAVVSVCPAEHHPYWMRTITEDGRLVDLPGATRRDLTRRQLLPQACALNGAIYLARREVLLAKKTWYTDRTYAYVMPPERSLDIDTPWHLHLARLILEDRTRCADDRAL